MGITDIDPKETNGENTVLLASADELLALASEGWHAYDYTTEGGAIKYYVTQKAGINQ